MNSTRNLARIGTAPHTQSALPVPAEVDDPPREVIDAPALVPSAEDGRSSPIECRGNPSTRNPANCDPARSIWAVRVDRPDGTHKFVGPEPGEAAAEARCLREQRQWSAAGLWAPSTSIVTMAAATFTDHARRHPNCTSAKCPQSGERQFTRSSTAPESPGRT